MSDSRTTATPETTNAAPTAHPPVRENQQASEAEVEQGAIAGQWVMGRVGGGSPETPPERFSGALGQLSGRSQVGMLRQLQRNYGNSYVGSVIQRKADGSGSCSECEKKDKEIQRKGEGDVSSVPDGFEAAMQRSGSGQPLDDRTRSFMESRFGQDFGEVKIHTDSAATEASEAVRAQAFTTGRDIYFGRGRYQPHYTEGKKLLAHELAHTIQQKNLSGVQTKLDISSPSDSLEQAADDTAAKVLSKGMDQVYKEYSSLSKTTSSLLTTPLIQRDFDPLAVGMTNPKVPASISVPSQNASYVTLPQASVSSTVVYDGLTLSTDSVQLDKTLGEIIKKSGKQALEGFRENLAATFANSPKFAEIAGTLLPKQESSSEAWPIVNKVLNLAIERANEILKSVEEFLEDFEKNAKTATYKILEESENQIKAEQKKYGITRTFEPAYTKLGVFLTGQNPQIPKYSVENNPESQDMAKAAADLATKRLEIKGLIQKQKALVQEVPFYMGHGKYISNQQEYDDFGKQIEEANRSYYLLRYDKESKFPLLATYAEDNESNIKILTAIGKGITAGAKPFDYAGSSTGIEYLAAQTFEKLDNIQKVREALGVPNKVNIWKSENILNGTKAAMGLKPDSIENRLIDDRAKQIASDEFWDNLLIAAVAIGLGLIAAVPSGGSSVALAITTVAALGSAGLGVYQAKKSLEEYQLASAESGTHFDKAKAISQEDPSLFWLAVEIVGVIADVGQVVSKGLAIFQKLTALRTEAIAAKAAGNLEKVEAALKNLEEVGNKEVKVGVGINLKKGIEESATVLKQDAQEIQKSLKNLQPLPPGGEYTHEIPLGENRFWKRTASGQWCLVASPPRCPLGLTDRILGEGLESSAVREVGLGTAGITNQEAKKAREILRASLGKSPKGFQAHHIIPYELRDHPVIDFLRRKFGWNINDTSNEIHLPENSTIPGAGSKTPHFGSHPRYNEMIGGRLDGLNYQWSIGKLSDQQLLIEVQALQSQYRNLLDIGKLMLNVPK
ncbi:eCIS core domain-containing protein [Nostoc sp.]|uniref:eCIS core domain-containing protein n=1 Tax=Nostoc sp. TaxID=1180 RepID=UPI002FF747D4